MEVLRDENGDFAINADDGFERYAMPIEEWIKAPVSKDDLEHGPKDIQTDQIIYRAGLAARAIEAYRAAAEVENSLNLRFPPQVLTNYIPTNENFGSVEYWFFFKEDNNGDTYRICHRKGEDWTASI